MPKPIRCILLVDDDQDDNFFHRLTIEKSGVCDEIRVAESGPDALNYLTHTDLSTYVRPDIIFLDVNMPGMNAFDFLDYYHKLQINQKSRLLMLMLTTPLNPADQERVVISMEVAGYHTKPLTVIGIQGIAEQFFN